MTNFDFDTDFNNFFIDREHRKQFRVPIKHLITTYPNIFAQKEYKKGIKLVNEEEETIKKAKEILKEYYLPYKIDSGKISVYQTTNTYVNKAGETKEYKLNSIYKLKNSSKFNTLKNNPKVQEILAIPESPTIKAAKIKDVVQTDLTLQQVYAWIYRNK